VVVEQLEHMAVALAWLAWACLACLLGSWRWMVSTTSLRPTHDGHHPTMALDQSSAKGMHSIPRDPVTQAHLCMHFMCLGSSGNLICAPHTTSFVINSTSSSASVMLCCSSTVSAASLEA
jgi:hypothetical protein